MKRKSTSVRIETKKENVENILKNSAAFITNWPYVVRVSTREGVSAEIMLPRFVFKFRDTYRFQYHPDFNSHIYDGEGKRGHMILVVTLKEWSKNVETHLELSYKGKGELLLGKTLQALVDGIGRGLKELAESTAPAHPEVNKQKKTVLSVDFSDPMSVAGFLAKSKMVHSGIHMVDENGLFNVVREIKGKIGSEILYVSGITQDGRKSFKLLLQGSQVLAVEYRDESGVRTIKVETDETAEKAMDILSAIDGPYTINVWVPVGGA